MPGQGGPAPGPESQGAGVACSREGRGEKGAANPGAGGADQVGPGVGRGGRPWGRPSRRGALTAPEVTAGPWWQGPGACNREKEAAGAAEAGCGAKQGGTVRVGVVAEYDAT